MLTPSWRKRLSLPRTSSVSLIRKILGDFELEPSQRQAGFLEHLADHGAHVTVPELRRREIDRDEQVFGPFGCIAAGAPQNPLAKRND